MTLTDLQKRSVRRLRGDTGARIYVTTREFWRGEEPFCGVMLTLAPVLFWARAYGEILDWGASVQRQAVRSLLLTLKA